MEKLTLVWGYGKADGTVGCIVVVVAVKGGGGGAAAEPDADPGCLFLFTFGMVVSPRTILTMQYSINAMNTNIVQTDMNASTAFKYDTGGNDACDLACCVDNVSSDVTPNVTLAGAASGLIQNETHYWNHFK